LPFLVHLKAIWYFCGHFGTFSTHSVCCTKKNLATLLERNLPHLCISASQTNDSLFSLIFVENFREDWPMPFEADLMNASSTI
jgi:hypothetical protein